MAKESNLLDDMDAAAKQLLSSVNGTTITTDGPGAEPQPIDIKGRIAAFAAVTDYLAVKHKIQPAGAKKNGLDGYRTAINGGATGRRANRQGASASGGAADAEDGDD